MSSLDVSRLARRIVVASVLFAGVVQLGAQAPELLFSGVDTPGIAAPAADPRPFVVRSRAASLSVGALDRALASPATNTFTLNLFDDATFAVTFERVEDSGFGPRTWTGHIADRPLSTVSLTLNAGTVTGMITDGVALFEINGLGGGVHRIDQMDMSAMPIDRDIAVPGTLAPGGADDQLQAAGPAIASPAASTATIFVYYSTALANAIGGAGAVQARIAQYVSNTNTAYARSGVDAQLTVVGVGELPVPNGLDSSDLLSAFAENAAVVNQRNASGADLVALLVGELGADPGFISCGIGYVGFAGASAIDAAFSVTASRSECVHTFAHEVGHNLGGQHTDEDGVIDPGGSSQFPAYARGHKAPNHAFRTIMAYDCQTAPSCPRVLNFSNPAVLEGGQVTGNASARNASRFNELFPQVANYRAGGPTPTAPGPPQLQAGPGSGSTLTLSWQAGPGGAPTDYLIAAGTGPGLSNLAAGLPVTGNSLTVPGVPNGSYWIRLYARNAAGISGPSNEVNVVIGSVCTMPSAPQSFSASKSGNNLTLTWAPPAAGGPTFIYGLLAGSSPGATNLFLGAIGSVTSIGGAVPNGTYFVRVIAANACGIGPTSQEIAITIP